MKRCIYCLAWLLVFTACNGTSSRPTAATGTSKPVFNKPEIPLTLTDRQAQADFMVEHYWDKFDFSDTAWLAAPDALEQALVDFFVLLPYAGRELSTASMARPIRQSQADTVMFRYFVEKAGHYLWDPNSPYRNEELYIPVLETIYWNLPNGSIWLPAHGPNTGSHWPKKTGSGFRQPISAIGWPTAPGARCRRFDRNTCCFFFNNPGCTACSEIIEHSNQSPVIRALLRDDRLTVLAVYPDQDLTEWEKYRDKMPADWINGYDPETLLKDQDIYDLKAIPTLYLLDSEKTVLLKDADIHIIERFLAQHALNSERN
ncbi:MAG: DUF5106 domain-containing protein [Rikenellaceae bacterium]|nr:DUF5106 domain-containing protein [Rikenellaceae bacterium]